MFLIVTTPILNPENEKTLYGTASVLNSADVQRLSEVYGIDSIHGIVCTTREAANAIISGRKSPH